MGILYLIATPIGNLEDITLRALRVLGDVSLIAAEDTRHSRKLLRHYRIETRVISYHEHNKVQRTEEILNALVSGDVALISDAGTPGLSDPGYELVHAATAEGHQISPIPGPSAPIVALVASGIPSDSFVFLGYLPRKAAARRNFLVSIAEERRTMVAFEVPHRLRETLVDLEECFGADRTMAVCREMTKLHEQILRGKIRAVKAHFARTEPQGEMTLVIAGKSGEAEWGEEEVRCAVREALRAGARPSDLARQVAKKSGWPRRKIYELIQEEK